jgi:hypothetical protein
MFDKDYYVDEYEIKAPCKKEYALEEEYRVDCKMFIKELKEVKITTLTQLNIDQQNCPFI